MTVPMSTVDLNSFPLFCLPWLGTNEVLKSMDACELFALSMISTKSKMSVKAITSKQPFPLTILDSHGIMLGADLSGIPKEYLVAKLKILYFGIHPIVQNSLISTRYKELCFGFKSCNTEDEDFVDWAKRIIKYITDVFNIKKIDCYFKKLRDECVIELIDYTKNELKLGFTRFISDSTTVTDEFYKYVLDNCMDVEKFDIFAKPSDNFKYELNSFKPKQKVSIEHAKWLTSQHLDKFLIECQEACLPNLRVSSQDLINFFQQWMQSDKMKNFYIRIKGVDFQQVIHGLEELDIIEHHVREPDASIEIQRNDGIEATIWRNGRKSIIIRTREDPNI